MQNGQQDQGRATDADKETYRTFLANTINMVYEPEIAQGVVEQMSLSSPVEAIAQTIAMVVNRVGQDGLARGVPVNGAMAVAAAATLAGDIGISMAEAAGREPLNADQIQAVFLRSMELLRDMQGEDGQGQGAAGPGAEAPMPGPGGPPPGPGPAAPPPGNGLMPRMA